MPIITVFADVPRAYNRVEVNWSDTPSVTHARVLRVDVEAGTCTPLRPYICYDGDALLLSCGHAIFWDTEVPLDRSVYYITEGVDAPCLPTSLIVSDTFSRDVVDGWGSADTGQAYTLSGGTNPGDYDVAGGQGTQALGTVNTRRHSFLDAGMANQNIYVDAYLPVTNATGAPVTQWLLGRLTDVNNWYMAQISLSTTGEVSLLIGKRVAGVVTDLTVATSVGTGHVANEAWRIRLSVDGSLIQAKAWRPADPEPISWQASIVDTDLPTGNGVGMASRLEVGSGDAGLISSWDNLLVGEPCEPCTPVTADTSDDPTTMPSNGAFRLKDPVRPCNDLYVPLCFTSAPPGCLPTSGIFFAQMSDESYEPNSLLLNPTNAALPLAVSRQRRGKSSSFELVTRTFADRDALLAINAPGSPLLLQGPADYGIPDAYLAIGNLGVIRGLSDHKFPIRINSLPFVTVVRPAGPSQGVCGSQVKDMCDIYETWDEIATAGLTWEDFLRGLLSHDSGAGPFERRTWDDVEAEFADWDAVEANGTWQQLVEGA